MNTFMESISDQKEKRRERLKVRKGKKSKPAQYHIPKTIYKRDKSNRHRYDDEV